MSLQFRLARPTDYARLEQLAIDSFEPITWVKKTDERFGPLNGKNWRERWQSRFRKAFDSQQVLVGEAEGEIVAFASGTIDDETRLGFIDLLGVDRREQGKGYGRQMLRGMLQYMKEQGAVHANLECLTDNDIGNNLYRSEGFEEVARHIRWFIKIP
ncbi:MAG TPA: GNAT family N-acetyltransferase [Bryobacteraceae bacterium]|nr:GNAT family N-acetyltransferase [Bryobacteraceae bacterium]